MREDSVRLRLGEALGGAGELEAGDALHSGQAAGFTWKRAAEQTLAVYESALQGM
jgi:hypothetical protein